MIVYRGRIPKLVMDSLLSPDGPAGDKLVKASDHVRHGDEDYGEPGFDYFEGPAFAVLREAGLIAGTYDGSYILRLLPDPYVGYYLVPTVMMTTKSGRIAERSL